MRIIYKELARKGDIIVVYNRKSWLHRLIVKVTDRGSRYKAGHVALYLGNTIIAEANSAGIHRKNWKDYTPGTHCVYLARFIGLTEEQYVKMYGFVMDSENEPYSFFQLPMILIKRIFRLKHVPDVSRKAMICSEFVCNAFRFVGVDLASGKNAAEVTPIDILCAENFEVIEGCEE
ncbi:MAG TPA: hypothetical protein PLI62_14215 [Spirochaetota bacterium]|nr:hypothetical protein [Spirochaetota bacterium]HQO03416.1 hypothetical protein [Spirochaetota bacterium]